MLRVSCIAVFLVCSGMHIIYAQNQYAQHEENLNSEDTNSISNRSLSNNQKSYNLLTNTGKLNDQVIDMTVNNAKLSNVIEAISKSYNLNIVGVESLNSTVTGRIKGITPEAVLEELSNKYNFAISYENGIYSIDESKNNELRHVQILEPNIVSAASIEPLLSVIVPKDKIALYKDRNQLVINGTKKEFKGVEAILNSVDRDVPQVRLEATIMAIEHSYMKETGIRWSWLSLTGHGEDQTKSYGAISFGRAPSGEAYRFFVKPELSLLETSGKAVIIATPSIMAVNGEEAHILIGERIPIVEESITEGERKKSVRYEEVGIKLDYTPYVIKEKYIDATIRAEVSAPILVSEMKAYKITTRQAKTRVRLKPGETLVIGGLMDNRDQKQWQKIPILGDIPLLGKLFRHSRKTKDSVEMIIFVKASVV